MLIWIVVILLVGLIGGAVGKGTIRVSKDEKGGRDTNGNKKKNEKVREANKNQHKKPDPNAQTK